MAKVCPQCQKVVKDLPAHLKRMHPATSKAKNEPKPPSENELEKELETLELPEQPGAETKGTLYQCVDCSAQFRGKQGTCPKCGTTLDWGGIDG